MSQQLQQLLQQPLHQHLCQLQQLQSLSQSQSLRQHGSSQVLCQLPSQYPCRRRPGARTPRSVRRSTRRTRTRTGTRTGARARSTSASLQLLTVQRKLRMTLSLKAQARSSNRLGRQLTVHPMLAPRQPYPAPMRWRVCSHARAAVGRFSHPPSNIWASMHGQDPRQTSRPSNNREGALHVIDDHYIRLAQCTLICSLQALLQHHMKACEGQQ